MAEESRDFEPLLISIERLLGAMDAQADRVTLEAAAAELKDLAYQYSLCCCRRAHVIKDPVEQQKA